MGPTSPSRLMPRRTPCLIPGRSQSSRTTWILTDSMFLKDQPRTNWSLTLVTQETTSNTVQLHLKERFGPSFPTPLSISRLSSASVLLRDASMPRNRLRSLPTALRKVRPMPRTVPARLLKRPQIAQGGIVIGRLENRERCNGRDIDMMNDRVLHLLSACFQWSRDGTGVFLLNWRAFVLRLGN